jgi:RimJ/RimL family protein N-acetyltransferase
MIKLIDCETEWPRIMKWIGEKVPMESNITCNAAFANEKDGEIVAATSLVNYNGANVYIQARIEPHGLTRDLIYRTFYHAFMTMQVRRISSTIIGDNIKSGKLTAHFGFKLEGVLHRIMPNGDNMYLSVLWPENCKYLEV